MELKASAQLANKNENFVENSLSKIRMGINSRPLALNGTEKMKGFIIQINIIKDTLKAYFW